MIKYRKNLGGFTMIEMLVSIALFLMLSGILFEVFTKANQVSRKSGAWIEIHQNARCLFDFLERDLAGVVLVGKTTGAGSAGRYFEACDDEGGVATDDASVTHDHDSIRFVSRTGARYGSIAEVGYYLSIDVSGTSDDMRKNEFGRYCDYPGDDLPNGDDLTVTSDADVWDPGHYKAKDVVAKGVTDLNIRVNLGDGNGFQNIYDNEAGISDILGADNVWTTTELESPLPKLVEITAYITDSKGIFLTGNTDAQPFCGKGLKFVHVVRVNRN